MNTKNLTAYVKPQMWQRRPDGKLYPDQTKHLSGEVALPGQTSRTHPSELLHIECDATIDENGKVTYSSAVLLTDDFDFVGEFEGRIETSA